MGLFGDILSLPVRIVNAPIKAGEKLIGLDDDDDMPKPSSPLEALAEALEEVDD